MIANRWMGFWFAPGSAANLGFARLVCVGLFFSDFEMRGRGAWSGMDDVLRLPTPLFDVLDLRPFPSPVLEGLALVCKTSLLLGALGLMTRRSLAIAAVLTFYLLGLRHNFGKVYYADAIIPLTLSILAAAPSGDRWSLDRVLARMRHRTFGEALPPASPSCEPPGSHGCSRIS